MSSVLSDSALPFLGKYVLPFGAIMLEQVAQVGGKNASLGEMVRALGPKGIRVPDGFAVTADAFRLHLVQNGLADRIYQDLDSLASGDVERLAVIARAIRQRITDAPLPAAVAAERGGRLRDPLEALRGDRRPTWPSARARPPKTFPTPRSPASRRRTSTCAGRRALESRGTRLLRLAVHRSRHRVPHRQRGFAHRAVALSVGVQKMVRSDLGSAGVIFTLDTESGFRDVVLVSGAWGLGETVVQGRVRPDEFWVHKPTLALGFRADHPTRGRHEGRQAGLRRRRLEGRDGGPRVGRRPPAPRPDR